MHKIVVNLCLFLVNNFLCQQSVQLLLEYFSDFVHHHLTLYLVKFVNITCLDLYAPTFDFFSRILLPLPDVICRGFTYINKQVTSSSSLISSLKIGSAVGSTLSDVTLGPT